MKHAYLIIAHSQFSILEKLISMLDYPLNDIYIHIDKKIENFDFEKYNSIPKYSNLIFIKNRIDVRWGHISLIECEYALMAEAFLSGPYLYYHLISGVDLPIKSQSHIHEFFNKNKGKEFVGFALGKGDLEHLNFKTKYYHLFTSKQRLNNRLLDFSLLLVRKIGILIQNILRINRKYGIEIKKGSNWVSITHNFVDYLLQNKLEVLNMFKYIPCADEIFIQSLLWNSEFRESIYNLNDEFGGSVREIDWKRGAPYIWKNIDQDTLLNSTKLFARKFDQSDSEIVELIYNKVGCYKEG